MHSNSSTSAVGGFFALKYLLYLKFIFHFHCLILVQPSLIHPQTIRTAFQLVPPLALDPPFPIHPTYFVSGTLPKIPLSLSSSREVQQLYHFKSRFPSILLNLTSLVLNILFLWSGQVLLYTSPQTSLPAVPWPSCLAHPFSFCHHNSASSRPTSNPFCLWSLLFGQHWPPFALGQSTAVLVGGWFNLEQERQRKVAVLQGNSWVLCPLFKNVTKNK